MKPKPTIDTSDFTSEEVVAKSADGTRVPLSIVHMRGIALDGRHPTQLYGYGAYGISVTPTFDPTELPWLRRGGIRHCPRSWRRRVRRALACGGERR